MHSNISPITADEVSARAINARASLKAILRPNQSIISPSISFLSHSPLFPCPFPTPPKVSPAGRPGRQADRPPPAHSYANLIAPAEKSGVWRQELDRQRRHSRPPPTLGTRLGRHRAARPQTQSCATGGHTRTYCPVV